MSLEGEGAGTGGDPGQGGSGAPSGGSPDGGSENDDKPITAKQLKAALASQRAHYEQRIEQQGRELEAFKAGAASQPRKEQDEPKRFTRAQLNAAVEAGQITREQADDTWEQQIKTEAVENATQAATQAVSRQQTQERIDTELAAYKRLKPEIMEAGSETRTKITEEYQYLVGVGQPRNHATELAAIRAVLGSLEKLEKSAGKQRSQDSDPQGGGGGDGKPRGGSSGNALVDKLDARWKDHYDKGIKQGRYKDWKEVEAELKFATPQRRQSMGLPS